MIILALDTAQKTGWCIYDTEEKRVIESGVQDMTKRRGESNGLLFLRFRAWMKTITGFLPRPGLIVYEQAHMRGGGAAEICLGLTGIVQEVAAKIGIESAPVHTGTLKKFATGSGTASKDSMMDAAEKILGRRPITNDEADAVLLALYAAREYGG